MFGFVRNMFRNTRRAPIGRVVLRDERTPGDTRNLSASHSSDGDLVIEGQDLGAGVEHAFGHREYEWVWTIAQADVPALSTALSENGDILDALARRFSGPDAAHLHSFLTENRIPFKTWSRIGD
jgi:hypothetical protein